MPTPPGPQHAAPNFSIPMQAPQFFVENAAVGTFIARQAVLSDPDSPNFGGGWMTVSKAGATATDHLEIKDGDGIVRSGATLLYNGVAIGTISGGANGTTLTVSFNSASTPAAAEALARSFTYRSTSDNPPSGAASFPITVDDGSGGEAQITGLVFVIPVNDAPVLANLFGDVSQFEAGSAPIRIDAGTMVSVSDVDTTDFNGGGLKIAITQGKVAGEDLLGFVAGSGVSVVADALVVNGIAIGSVIQGQNGGGNDLWFLLNSSATSALIAQAIHAVTYGNSSAAPLNGVRSIQVMFDDGDGTSNGGVSEITGVVQVQIGGGSEPPLLTLGSAVTSDMAMSADGSRIYEAGNDGFVRVYNANTGLLLATWDVGTKIGAMALSPDGSYLIAVERDEISEVQGVSSTIAAYRIDTASGAMTTYQTTVPGSDGAFWDVAILGGNKVLFVGSFNGQTLPHILDLATGTFTASPNGFGSNATVSTSSDFSQILLSSPTSSSAPIALAGLNASNHLVILDQTDLFSAVPITSGFNHGAHAVSIEAGYVAQDAGGLHIWDLVLNYQFGLDLGGQFNIAGLVFDPDGEFLFVLDSDTDQIRQVSLADHVVVRTISIGANAIFNWAVNDRFVTYANRILVTEDLGRFAVTTGQSIMRIDMAMPSLDLTGTSGPDNLVGSIGDDSLDGGSGADTMAGGHGDDVYHVDNAGDVIVEAARKGSDLVIASVDYTLTAGAVVERIESVNGTAAIDLGGNEFAQTLVGNAGANILDGGGGADRLDGGAGDDIYVVDNSADVVIEAAQQGNDTIFTSVSYTLAPGSEVETLSSRSHIGTDPINLVGNNFNQTIYGNAGDNLLNGLGGIDIMFGLAGNDTYVVDNEQDQVFEGFDGGDDTVFTDISYSLGSNQYIETLSTQTHNATVNLNLVGNQLNNYLYGNFGNNLLNGVDGADTMIGLYGDDTYSIDNAGDLVIELEGQGNDVVFTFVSHTLTNGNEVETLSTVVHTATTAIDLGGNDYANHLIGNYGNNYLNGGGGADVMTGLAGNDTYVVDNAGDLVEEAAGGGSDTVFTFVSYMLRAGQEIELLSTAVQSGTAALGFQGNEFGQTIVANNGGNTLDGGLGNDVLTGLGGADLFAFRSALGPNNIDTITDFVVGVDKIGLDQSIFQLDASFGLGQRFNNQGVAQDADDRIIYNQATGQLFYDADGNGAGAMIQFAVVSGAPPLGSADFMIF